MKTIDIKQAQFIEVLADVRYLEDGFLNGYQDIHGEMPLLNGKLWKPIINLQTGNIESWPTGVTAMVEYKVCDQGDYWLLDKNKQRLAKWNGHYVPNDILCININGLGDYIIFDVAENGTIVNWQEPILDAEEWDCIQSYIE